MRTFTDLAVRYLTKLGYRKSGKNEYTNNAYRALIKPNMETISITSVNLTPKGEYCAGHISENTHYQCSVSLKHIKEFLRV